jgi:hypothetical protein
MLRARLGGILLLLGLLLALFGGLRACQTGPVAAQIDPHVAILAALKDSLRYSRNQLGREVAEKRAIEGKMRDIQAHKAEMSANQRELLRDIAQLSPKKGKVTQATAVAQVVTIHVRDSVQVPSRYELAWQHTSDTLNYAIQVQDSTLIIQELSLPNRLSVLTYRDPETALHVQVTNSNPRFRTSDVDQLVLEPRPRRRWLPKVLLFVGGLLVGAISAH